MAPMILKTGIKTAVQNQIVMMLFIQEINIVDLTLPIFKLGLGNLRDNFGQVFFDHVSGLFAIFFTIKNK